jgi:methionine synthase II (cobalamin-independent)
MRADGEIPAGTRFQVSLPTPMAVVWAFIVPDQLRSLWPAYEHAMNEEIAEIMSTIRHADLAIQMDVAAEVVALETRESRRDLSRRDLSLGEVVEAIARVSNPIPPDVELGIHLCYGDPGGKHVVQPGDLGFSVEMANRLIAAINRPIGWIHMPVPIDRDDDAYFAPLKNLALKPGTELYLGLVHFRDGLEGAARRIAAARKFSPVDFGIAFECGLGRRPPDEPITKFLELHREIATGV